jgi:hypothetical protein
MARLQGDAYISASSSGSITSRGRRDLEFDTGLLRVIVDDDCFKLLLARSDVEKLEITQRCNGYTTYLRYYLDLTSYPDRYFECTPLKQCSLVSALVPVEPTQEIPDTYDGKYSYAGTDYTFPGAAYNTEYTHTESKRVFRLTLVDSGRWIWRQLEDPLPLADTHGMCAVYWHRDIPASYKRCTDAKCTDPLWTCLPTCAIPKEHLCAPTVPKCGCQLCGAPASKRCSRCRLVSYCSKECQISNWGVHRSVCASV